MNYVFLRDDEIVIKVYIDKFCYKDYKTKSFFSFKKSNICSHTVSIWTNYTEKKPYILILTNKEIYNNKNIFEKLSEEDKKHFTQSKKWWN